jgi:iron complex outermembrane receptor protein
MTQATIAADAAGKSFAIPTGDAVATLKQFMAQSGGQLIYSGAAVEGVRTSAVQGEFTTRAALERMLVGTGLAVTEDEKSGALAVTRAKPPDPTKDSLPTNLPTKKETSMKKHHTLFSWVAALFMSVGSANLPAQTSSPAAPASSPAPTEEQVIKMSAFEVTSSRDAGYKAVNSVSATRIAIPIGDLPMTLTALTDDFIKDQTDYDLYDIVKWSGVHQDNTSQSGWVRWNLRGFTNTAIQRNGITTNFRFLDPADVERIEIVKGPASLLYGQINPGGLINYITKRPLEHQQTSLSVEGGDHGYHRTLVDVTGPVPSTHGKLLYRAILMYENIARFSQLAEGHKQMFASSLTWKMTPNVTLNLEYENFQRREPNTPSSLLIVYVNGTATLPYPGLPHNFSFTGIGDWQKYFSQALSAELLVKVTDHIQLHAIIEQSEFNQRDRITGQAGTGILTQAVIDQFYPAGTLPPQHAMYRRNRYDNQESDEQTGQIELTGDFDVLGVKLRPLFGFKKNFYTNTHNVMKTNTTLAPWDMRNPATWNRIVPYGMDALNLNSDSNGYADNYSYYGVLAVSAFKERLQALGGYGHYSVHNPPALNNVTGAFTSPDSSRAANVPQVGVLYRVTPEVSAFASYSESFLANTALLRLNSDVRTIPAKPSVGKGYEGGLKIEFLNGRISGTVSYFDLKVNPTAVFEIFGGTAPDGRMLFTDVQGGSQKSTGYEANLLFTVVRGMQLYLNYTKTDAVYTQHPTNASFNGTHLVGTPDQSFNIWCKYILQGGSLKGFYFGGGVSYAGSFVSQASNPIVSIMPSYTTYDVVCGYPFHIAGRVWTADLAVRNLTNKFYYASASSFGPPLHGVLSLSTKF